MIGRGYVVTRYNRKVSDQDLPPGEYRALAEFRYQIRRFLHFSETAARAAGLEPRQHQLLLALKGLPPGVEASIGVLAERLQLQHHSTVELVDRLEARGLVRRHRDPGDRRRVLVDLTGEGSGLLRGLSVHHRRELGAVGPALVRALERVAGEALPVESLRSGNASE